MATVHINPKVTDKGWRQTRLRQYRDGTIVAYDKESGQVLAEVTGLDMQQQYHEPLRFTVSFIHKEQIELVDYPYYGSFEA